MSVVDTPQFTLPSNPADQQDIRNALDQISGCMLRKAAESTLISETKKYLFETFQIPKSIINEMVKVHFKQNFDEVAATQEAFQENYQVLINNTKQGQIL